MNESELIGFVAEVDREMILSMEEGKRLHFFHVLECFHERVKTLAEGLEMIPLGQRLAFLGAVEEIKRQRENG